MMMQISFTIILTFLLDRAPVCLLFDSEACSFSFIVSSALFCVGTASGFSINFRFPGKFIDCKNSGECEGTYTSELKCKEHTRVDLVGTKFFRLQKSIQMTRRFFSSLSVALGNSKKCIFCSKLFWLSLMHP